MSQSPLVRVHLLEGVEGGGVVVRRGLEGCGGAREGGLLMGGLWLVLDGTGGCGWGSEWGAREGGRADCNFLGS